MGEILPATETGPKYIKDGDGSRVMARGIQTIWKDDEALSWQDEANCQGVDPDLFFPERGASTREAKETCRNCIVRLACLEYALTNGEKFGVWGGLSERERRRLRKQRALAARKVTA